MTKGQRIGTRATTSADPAGCLAQTSSWAGPTKELGMGAAKGPLVLFRVWPLYDKSERRETDKFQSSSRAASQQHTAAPDEKFCLKAFRYSTWSTNSHTDPRSLDRGMYIS